MNKMKSNIVLIDNYDSFTYNLVHHIEEITGKEIDVYRNDEIDINELNSYDYIFISPGPGLPEDSGITLDLIKRYYESKKIFGVCLGLQAIIVALGGKLVNLEKVYHGIETEMKQGPHKSKIFHGVPEKFIAGRYHSWVADFDNFPGELEICCTDNDGQVMAIQHKSLPVYAVQFHPESIMTPEGKTILRNFLELNAITE